MFCLHGGEIYFVRRVLRPFCCVVTPKLLFFFSFVCQVKSEMDKRVDELDNLELTSQNKAELILEHADLVEAAIQIIRSAVASGMHWDDLSGASSLRGKMLRTRITFAHSRVWQ